MTFKRVSNIACALGIAAIPALLLSFNADSADAMAGLHTARLFTLTGSFFFLATLPTNLPALALIAAAECAAGYFGRIALGGAGLGLWARAACYSAFVVPLFLCLVLAWTVVAGVCFAVNAAALKVSFCLTKALGQTKSFRGKRVFITGGGTGLGKELAKKLAAEGARVTIVSRNEHNLRAACEDAKSAASAAGNGGECRWAVCDVTDAAAVKAALGSCEKEGEEEGGKGIDLVVTSAGLSHPGRMPDVPVDAFRREMELNYFGTLNVVHEYVQGKIARRERGEVLIVSSALGLIGSPGYCPYAASKYALRGLAESMCMELPPRGIDVHVYYPSNMRTPGYEEENKTKPGEAKLIDESTQTMSAEEAADVCLERLRRGYFAICGTSDIELLRMGNGSTVKSDSPLTDFLMFPIWWIGLGVQRIIWKFQVASHYKKTNIYLN